MISSSVSLSTDSHSGLMPSTSFLFLSVLLHDFICRSQGSDPLAFVSAACQWVPGSKAGIPDVTLLWECSARTKLVNCKLLVHVAQMKHIQQVMFVILLQKAWIWEFVDHCLEGFVLWVIRSPLFCALVHSLSPLQCMTMCHSTQGRQQE